MELETLWRQMCDRCRGQFSRQRMQPHTGAFSSVGITAAMHIQQQQQQLQQQQQQQQGMLAQASFGHGNAFGTMAPQPQQQALPQMQFMGAGAGVNSSAMVATRGTGPVVLTTSLAPGGFVTKPLRQPVPRQGPPLNLNNRSVRPAAVNNTAYRPSPSPNYQRSSPRPQISQRGVRSRPIKWTMSLMHKYSIHVKERPYLIERNPKFRKQTEGIS